MGISHNQHMHSGVNYQKRFLLVVLCSVINLTLIACSANQPQPTRTPESGQASSTPTLESQPTPTAATPKLLYYHHEDEAYRTYAHNVLITLQERAHESGMDLFEVSNETELNKLGEYRVVVFFSPGPDLLLSLPTLSQTTYVMIDPSEPVDTRNAWTIGSLRAAEEQAAFLAGYIATLITPDWRVGAIGTGAEPGQANLLEAFAEGGQFFCGLCRPAYPPYFDYPAVLQVPTDEAGAIGLGLDDAETRDLGLLFLDKAGIEVVGGLPRVESYEYLGIQPPPENFPGNWIGTLRPAPEQALVDNWASILNGSPVQSLAIPILIEDANPDRLSQGKLRLVQEIRDDLVAGFIQPIGGLE